MMRDKEFIVDELIANSESDDQPNATQGCRDLNALLSDKGYGVWHPKIKEAIKDAQDKWGDKNWENWCGSQND